MESCRRSGLDSGSHAPRPGSPAWGPGDLLDHLAEPPHTVAGIDVLLTRARDAGLHPRAYAVALDRLTKLVADRHAGIDRSQWRPELGAAANRDIIFAVYDYYGRLHLEHPYMVWAAMANLVGPSFAAAFFDLGQLARLAHRLRHLSATLRIVLPGVVASSVIHSPDDFRFYESELLRAQRNIYDDVVPAHQRYIDGGLPAVEEMHRAGIITESMWRAFVLMDEGRRSGDEADLFRSAVLIADQEQNVIINGNWDRMRERDGGGAMTYALTAVGRPSIPGSRRFAEVQPMTIPWLTDIRTRPSAPVRTPLPGGNISYREQRWAYFLADTAPAAQQQIFSTPDRSRELIAVPVEQRIGRHRFLRHLEAIARLVDEGRTGSQLGAMVLALAALMGPTTPAAGLRELAALPARLIGPASSDS